MQKIHKYRQKTERRVSEVSSDTYGESSTRQSSINESSSTSDDHHRKQSVSTDFSSETSIELATLGYDEGSTTTAECISNINSSTNTKRRIIKITSNPGYQVRIFFVSFFLPFGLIFTFRIKIGIAYITFDIRSNMFRQRCFT